MEMREKRHLFSGKLGFILASAGASVGLGNIWRFPYLAAQYGGGIFLLVYVLFAVTFGYTMIVAETVIGRMTRRAPARAYTALSSGKPFYRVGGWLNAVIPMIIVSYYAVIGGWVVKYFAAYLTGGGRLLSEDGAFGTFIASPVEAEIYFAVFTALTMAVIYMGVQQGIERVSKVMMPVLVVLAVVIAVYSCTRPGAMPGVRYFLVPDFSRFSYKTILAALTQMFYSLSIAMGILVTFGSYMKDDVSIERSTLHVELFDTGVAFLAGLMVIPAVFAYSGGQSLNSGPSLMFVTLPKVLNSMDGGQVIGVLFFALVLFAALTSAIALAECGVCLMEEHLHWSRGRASAAGFLLILALGSLSCLGFGPLGNVRFFGMQFLDLFDFLSNSVMMPAAALATCLLVTREIGLDAIAAEVEKGGMPFRMRPLFGFMIRWVCPVFVLAVLAGAVAGMFGWISI
ncbi:MAG: sodium-dependent transporter [Oscillibacter sp.]|nr:sodium-dependent transporter [Oscillibacter sp.]